MNIREGIKQILAANTRLIALGLPAIWSQFAPAGTSIDGQWIVMTRISTDETGAHDGNGNLTTQRFQFTVGGTRKEIVDSIVDILIQDFNAVSFSYVENSVTYELSFYNAGSQDGWEDTSRVYSPSVDMLIMANY
jgi:hypothetical protein